MNPAKATQLIKREAANLGFSFIGISKARHLEEETNRLEDWLKNNHHGQMAYMENWFDKRLDPRKLVPGAKSVISLFYNYYTSAKQQDQAAPKLSMYAYGTDYHKVIRKKLKNLIRFVRSEIGEVNGRAFVDSAPVMEKAWAAKSGLGWIGKHTNLINKSQGSYFFLSELILDLPLEEDRPTTDHCGTCTRCIDACPTDAIFEPYKLDGSRCISYLTIELKPQFPIPTEFGGKMHNWVFGCDICQQVCPWNRFSRPHSEPEFEADERLLKMTKAEWHELTEEVFKELFSKSPVERTKWKGLKRNLLFLEKPIN